MAGFFWDDSGVERRVRAFGDAGLLRGAEILAAASARMAPIESGALIGSIVVGGENGRAEVAYTAPYAVKWHETPAHFAFGRKSKYLEDAVNDAGVQAAVAAAIADGVRAGIGG